MTTPPPITRYLAILAGFSFVINMVLLAPSLMMLQVYDRVLVSRSLETLLLIAFIAIAWLLLGLLMDVLRQRVLGHSAAQLDRQWGEPVLRRLLARAAGPQRNLDMGPLRQLAQVRGFLGGAGILSLCDLPWIPIYLLAITLFHPLLGLIALLAMATLVALTWAGDRFTRAATYESQAHAARAGQFVQGSIRAADVVAAPPAAPCRARRWLREHARSLKLADGAARFTVVVSAVQRFLRQALQVVMLGVGAWLVIVSDASPGIIIAATLILGRMLAPLEAISSQWKQIGEFRGAWRGLQQELASLPLAGEAFELPAPQGRLEVRGVSFQPAADRAPTVKRVSVLVEPGETLVVLGSSGSGKSTLAKMITGVWTPTDGSVHLDGIDLSTWAREQLGPHVGYCPQDVQLLDGTVADNIARFGDADSQVVTEAAERAQCADLIASLPRHYETPVGEAGVLLSGGQRQRVALARALYGRPRLVVLDEPNASLDEEGEQRLDQVLRTLKAEGVTTVVVSHRPQVMDRADKIIVMKDGAIERIGTRTPAAIQGQQGTKGLP